MSELVVSCRHLKKSYHDGRASIHVLNGIDFDIEKGERIAIVGPSGSGKSTFLHLLGGLDNPTSGDVKLHGTGWETLSENERCRVRNRSLGFVYQFHHLLPEFSALENVALPLLLAGQSLAEVESKARTMLKHIGLGARESHKPAQLSGGERQRVAIARALINQPQCVFADEPTGNLDHATATKVFDLMLDLNTRYETALVIVTHDQQLAAKMDKVFVLQEGKLQRSES